MPFPSDTEVRRALRHPLRRQLLPIYIGNRPLSPKEASRLVGQRLSTVSYHVRVLVKYRFLILLKQEAARGSTKHYYIPNDEIVSMPIVKELLADGRSDPT